MGIYENAELPMFVNGNVYLNNAKKFPKEASQLEIQTDPQINVIENGNSIVLEMNFDGKIAEMKNQLVTTELLGKAKIPNVAFENRDGLPYTIDTDFSGNQRDKKNPTAGPFENPGKGKISITVWANQ